MAKNHTLRVIITSLLLAVMVVCLTAVMASAHTVTVSHLSGCKRKRGTSFRRSQLQYCTEVGAESALQSQLARVFS